MTAVAEPPPPAPGVEEQTTAPLHRGEGVELLGPVHGSGYKEGAALVRRDDGQMVHLGPLMYALLEEADGRRDNDELALAMSERLGRGLDEQHVVRLAEKLADQGLLAGTEHKAPPKRNPLLALRWKVLVTNPEITRRLTAPFTFLFRPWLMGPVLAGFLVVCWFVLFHKGVASATAQAFNSPGLLLLVFGLAVVSAGFHELGHAAACRYGGATPAGMGVGIYLVWPAFYTDVTDAYRLPKRSRLRVDLGGLYFNAVVADLTLVAWLLWRVDALLLLVALQLLEMVKQLSPVIRADGYHILSDATGIPDLFSHIGPTMRRLIPGRREPSALTGRARVLVTSWVLIIVPVLLSLALSAVLLLPKLATNAWDSGNHLISAIPHQLGDGDILGFLASLLRLFALFMPVIGSALVSQKFARMTVSSARSWSEGSAVKRTAALAAGAALIAGLAWAWWPAGQYQPVRATDRGTLVSLGPDGVVTDDSGPPGAGADADADGPADARPPPGRVDDPGRRRDQAAPGDVRDLAGQGQACGRDRLGLGARPVARERRDLLAEACRRHLEHRGTVGAACDLEHIDHEHACECHGIPVPAPIRPGSRWHPGARDEHQGRRCPVRRRLLDRHRAGRRARDQHEQRIRDRALQGVHDRRGLFPDRAGHRAEQDRRADQRGRRAQLQLHGLPHHRDRRPDRGDAQVAAVQGAGRTARRRPQAAQRAARARIQRDARGRRLRGRRGSTGDRDAAARQRLDDDLLEHDESGLFDRLDLDLVVIVVRRHHHYVVLLELAADLVDPLWVDDDHDARVDDYVARHDDDHTPSSTTTTTTPTTTTTTASPSADATTTPPTG